MLQHTSRLAEPPLPALRHGFMQDAGHGIGATECALLALADPCPDSRISLIGPNTLELLCALLRRGSTNVSATRLSDWPQVGTADVAIIPSLNTPDTLCRAVAHARRVLAPLGTVAIHLASDPADALSQHVRRLLLLHGFEAVRVRDFSGEALIRAELPLHGRIACA